MDGLSIKNSNVGATMQKLGVQGSKLGTPTSAEGVDSFADTLKTAVHKVNDLQQVADTKMQQLATGETTDIADVKIAAEKADIALRLMSSVRNKMIDAYHEIMKMQV